MDGLTGTETNLDSGGLPVTVNLAPAEISKLDPKHDWDSSHRAFNGGRNDGFVIVNPGANQAEVMSYHQRATAPYLYSLCDQYAVCDRWFSSVMGPTWPNRYYLHAATAAGHKTNLPMGLNPPPTVWQRLADRCVPAGYYYAGNVPWYSVTFPANSFSGDDAVAPQTIDHFFTDAARGALPSFSIIDPRLRRQRWPSPLRLQPGRGVSEQHSPRAGGQRPLAARPDGHHVRRARRLLRSRAPADGPRLRSRLPPDRLSRPGGGGGAAGAPGAVVSTPYDHVSVLATLATRFGIASLGPRMDAAADLSACIDPDRASVMAPVAALPPTDRDPGLGDPQRSVSADQPAGAGGAGAGGRRAAHHVDPRGPGERLQAWLRHAQALEAVRVSDEGMTG